MLPEGLRRNDARGALALAAVMVAIALSFAVSATPVSAAGSKIHLSNPSVSARTGTVATTFVFSVLYRNDLGVAADWVNVIVGGSAHPMTRQTGGDWINGVTFRWSGRFPAGTDAVSFRARSRGNKETALTSGSITVSPNSTPSPTRTPRRRRRRARHRARGRRRDRHRSDTDAGPEIDADADSGADRRLGTASDTDGDRAAGRLPAPAGYSAARAFTDTR